MQQPVKPGSHAHERELTMASMIDQRSIVAKYMTSLRGKRC